MTKKTVLVTGGNSGIGFATARLFHERGYNVTISGRDRERIEQAAGALSVNPFIADMGSPEDLKNLASSFRETGLDVLVNNAAIAQFIPLAACTPQDYDSFFNINLRGPLLLIQEMLPALEKKRGCIINVSSIIVNNGLPNAALYAASKGGVDAFSKSLALELAPKGIRVNVVAPGATETPILDKLGLTADQLAAVKRQQEAMIPLQRFARPEEIAQVIVAQAEASYVTGAVWNVDGGVNAT
ncbi:MAG: SDR family oxidoreductase [Deltaproteobacteria bacterium]|nr:SDR family oxidoreductase [Deltaproteobacteria bacterium]